MSASSGQKYTVLLIFLGIELMRAANLLYPGC